MKSPFPGMDPYLERLWPDVHTRFVAYAADQLNERLPPELVASTEERVAIEEESTGDATGYRPDVVIVDTGSREPSAGSTGYAAVGTAEMPIRLVADERPAERFIQIVELGTGHVVTVIELLSPANKVGAGVAAYRQKRAELKAAGVNLVEIDLVREGNWRALLSPHRCPPRGESTYRATVRLAAEPHAVYLYPLFLNQPLVGVRVPLRAGDPEVQIDLQNLIEAVYARGRYDRRVDYRKPLDPPLPPGEGEWAEELLRNAGYR